MAGAPITIGSFDDLQKETANEFPYATVASGMNGYENTSVTFTLKLLKLALDNEPTATFVTSPYAYQTTLGMCYLGAESLTKQELNNAVFPDCINTMGYISKLTKAAAAIKTLRTVARLYATHRAEFHPVYKMKLTNVMPSKGTSSWTVTEVDFGNVDANRLATHIDVWIDKKLGGVQNTTGVFSPNFLRPDARILLAQAFCYDTTWRTPFRNEKTMFVDNDGYFYETANSHGVFVEYMQQRSTFRFCQNNRWKVLRKETSDKSISFYFLLPNHRCDLNSSDLGFDSAGDLVLLFKQCTLQTVTVVLPKFSVQQGWREVTATLGKLELRDSLNYLRANFCYIASVMDLENGLAITTAVEKYAFNMNEGITGGSKGGNTQAVQATAGTSKAEDKPKGEKECQFIADHPFLFFMVAEEQSNLFVLLAGRYSGPKK